MNVPPPSELVISTGDIANNYFSVCAVGLYMCLYQMRIQIFVCPYARLCASHDRFPTAQPADDAKLKMRAILIKLPCFGEDFNPDSVQTIQTLKNYDPFFVGTKTTSRQDMNKVPSERHKAL
jgi:hypothetical protein